MTKSMQHTLLETGRHTPPACTALGSGGGGSLRGSRRAPVCVGLCLAALAASAGAQTLSDVIPSLFERAATLSDPAGAGILLDVGVDPSGIDHSLDFYGADVSNRVREVGGALRDRIGSEFATPQLGDFAGALVHDWDPESGRFERSSLLLGSPFVRRPDTLGKGMWSVALGFSQRQFEELDGTEISRPGFDFNLRAVDAAGDGLLTPYYEGDLIRVQSSFSLTQEIAALQVRAGVTERLDLGVTVPFVRNELSARVLLQMDRISTPENLRLHRFLDPRIEDDLVFAGGTLGELDDGGTSSRLGDVRVDAQ